MSLFSYDMDKFQSLTTETISSFTMQSTFWGFGACVLGFVIIGLIKFWKKNKKGLLSSLIGFLLVFLLFPLGFFGAGFSNSIINFVGGIITDDFKIKFLINGLLWSLMGIGIIWFALKKENTTHNNTYNPLRRIS